MVPQLHIKASTAYDVGLAHGAKFPTQIRSSIAFYARLFHRSTGLTWPQVRLEASKFLPLLDNNEGWRRYVEEMKGVADGAGEGVEFEDVLALNVRTEIAYGMAWDGCTALAWRQGEGDGRRSFLAQNWDVSMSSHFYQENSSARLRAG